MSQFEVFHAISIKKINIEKKENFKLFKSTAEFLGTLNFPG